MVSMKELIRPKLALMACLFLVLACHSGCGRLAEPQCVLSWSDLINDLIDVDRIARLDTIPSAIITSYDPSGGNNDFNHFIRKGPPGWVVLADLKGPGYISRFWMTGAENGEHRLRFLFDNERTPRLDITLGEFCGGKVPFLPPLANHENYCWYSYVPIPYARRLLVMAQEGGYKPDGWPRLFYQINYSSLPRGMSVQTFPEQISEKQAGLLRSVSQAWRTGDVFKPLGNLHSVTNAFTVEPSEFHELPLITGPGMIRKFSVTIDNTEAVSPDASEKFLRDIILRIKWNDASGSSVQVPLGDFFGSFWRRTRVQSMFLGLSNNTFQCRFPMPFQSSAHISFENQGTVSTTIETRIEWEPLAGWNSVWGYFHSGWTKSGPAQVGQPHEILRADGRGKYVGCILGVTSADKSWWILEGDEVMYVDGGSAPYWHGTGLEDYFNGGWYYQNVLIRPLNGLLFKAFFRTVQYRLHLTDPVLFDSSFNMFFERGPDNASHGWMESVAYYYMENPVQAYTQLGTASQRVPPEDPLSSATVMTELFNYERFRDYKGAYDYIDYFLEKHRDFPFSPVLRLRQIAYIERLKGNDIARSMLEQFISREKDDAALQQARLLQWFNESPSHALLGIFSNTKTRAFVDEQCVGEGGPPEKLMVYKVKLSPGSHVFSIQSQYRPYPDWVQSCLMTHQGMFVTSPDWKVMLRPAGNWKRADYDDSAWPVAGGTGVKGPPEPPFIWVEPNAFVDMQSMAIGLRPSHEWTDKKGTKVYRKLFTVP